MDPPAPRAFEGCIYGEQPLNPKYRLSAEQLSSLQLVGLPVCVEHEAEAVGRVINARVTPDGRAYVKWELADHPSGWACEARGPREQSEPWVCDGVIEPTDRRERK